MITKFLDWAAEPPDRSHENRSRTPVELWWMGVCLFVVTIAGGQMLASGLTEGYCWVWPGVSTDFARGYSERQFAAIRPGMTQQEVVDRIGPALSRRHFMASPAGQALWQRGDQVWDYAREGGHGNWAWLSREVVFRGDVVVQTVRWTYHD